MASLPPSLLLSLTPFSLNPTQPHLAWYADLDESALHAWIAKEFDALGIETVFLTHNAHVPYSHIVIAQLGEDAYAFQEFLRGRTFDAVHLLDPYVAYQALVLRSLGSHAFGDAAFVLELSHPAHHAQALAQDPLSEYHENSHLDLQTVWMQKKVVELADVVVAPSHFTFENLVLESGFPINANTHVQPTTDSLRHVPADDAAGSGAKAASMAAYMRPQAPRWIDGVAFLGRLASRKAIDAVGVRWSGGHRGSGRLLLWRPATLPPCFAVGSGGSGRRR